MYYSGETRWFFRGEMPEAIAAWFGAGESGQFEPERTDFYLGIPLCRTLGVKIREGRLELKALVGSAGVREFADTVTAIRETWVKWSVGGGRKGMLRDLVTRPDDHWIQVSKKRCLRRFSLENGKVKETTAPAVQSVPGCQVELTAVDLILGGDGSGRPGPGARRGAESWWSLSLESFGQPESAIGNLDRTAEQFFGTLPPIPLPEARSLSYPAWLADLQSAGPVTE